MECQNDRVTIITYNKSKFNKYLQCDIHIAAYMTQAQRQIIAYLLRVYMAI